MLFSAREISTRAEVVIWLILPVVICLSKRLSHASASDSEHHFSEGRLEDDCERLIKTVMDLDGQKKKRRIRV